MYSWMIIYGDKTTEIVEACDVQSAILAAKEDWYEKGVHVVIRMD